MQNIVVVGAGFGGLHAALRLARKLKKAKLHDRYTVILIDRNAYHTFTPLLYEIACTSRTSADDETLESLVGFPIDELVRGSSVEFVNEEVRRINFVEQTVDCKSRSFSFAYCIIALGAEPDYFAIPGLKEAALPLKTLKDALVLRDAVMDLLKKSTGEMLHIVVAGGGPTGVEIAGEMKMWACALTAEAASQSALHVSIVDANPSVLSSFDQRVQARVTARLRKLGVGILARERVKRVYGSHILLESGEKLHHDLLIWTGGVRANAAAESFAVEKEPRGRIMVGQDTSCIFPNQSIPASERVYAIGDVACLMNPHTKNPAPGAARPAIMQARVAADSVFAAIAREEQLPKIPALRAYRHRTYPYVVPVGGRYAVTKMGPLVIRGFVGWLVKNAIELNYFFSIMPFRKALGIWLKGVRIFMKNDRLE